MALVRSRPTGPFFTRPFVVSPVFSSFSQQRTAILHFRLSTLLVVVLNVYTCTGSSYFFLTYSALIGGCHGRHNSPLTPLFASHRAEKKTEKLKAAPAEQIGGHFLLSCYLLYSRRDATVVP